ncbi:MAG: Crp/Fnr family transcriptional regulator [Syntrophorhabdus sp.]
MKKEYKDKLRERFPHFEKLLNKILIKEVPSGTTLLSEGDIATKLFLVIHGCLRTYFIKETGIEITSQFFIEGQMVSSFESAMTGMPSRQYIDAIEDSTVGFIEITIFKKMISESGLGMNDFNRFLISRLIFYMNQHASFILDNPEKRYKKLLQDNPELVSRLPQKYIASYLGITPVSLARIRTRLRKQINNC